MKLLELMKLTALTENLQPGAVFYKKVNNCVLIKEGRIVSCINLYYFCT